MQTPQKKYHYCFEKKQLPKKIAFYKRLIVEILVSLLFTFLIILIHENTSFGELSMGGIAFTILIFVLLSEGIFTFDSVVAKRYPWHQALFKRVFSLLSFALFWMIFTGFLARLARPYFIPVKTSTDKINYVLGLTILVLFITIYVFALIAANYHNSLKYFILENEKLRQEKLKMDYFALQDQLNPHFLFNNLSTLMAIIPENSGKALSFTENFTDVYRYVLKSSKRKLVTLKEEINFIKAYLGLHKERLGNGFFYGIDTDKEELDKYIPPLSLQYLVENAIKHNLATESQPLTLSILTKNNKLVVSNTYQPKSSTYSTNTGLANLKKRYEYLSLKNKVEILSSNETFTASIPLIEKNYDHGL
jgi:two-component system, LytTR family, sensor kinase